MASASDIKVTLRIWPGLSVWDAIKLRISGVRTIVIKKTEGTIEPLMGVGHA